MPGRAYCLDSDVIIWHLRNAHRRAKVTDRLAQLSRLGTLSCSALTVAEIFQGIRPGEESGTRALFDGLVVLPIDREIAERAGTIVADLRRTGRTLGLADAVIAATCIEHGMALVTMNERDFGQIQGLDLQLAA